MCPLPFDVVVVTFLNGTDLLFEAQDLGPILAKNTCRWRDSPKCRVLAILRADVAMLSIFESQHLLAIGTNPAVRRGRVAVLLHDAFSKGFQHFGMIAKVASFHELNIGMFGGNLI